MATLTSFWLNADKWPTDRSGNYTFLAASVLKLGPLIAGPSWTGTEPYTPPLLNLPSAAFYQGRESLPIGGLVRIHEVLVLSGLASGPIGGRFSASLSDEQISEGLRSAAALDRIRRDANARLAKVADAIATAIVRRELAWALRSAGKLIPMESVSAWNDERVIQRFRYGQMHPDKPFGAAVAGDDFVPIFIETNSLNAFAASLAPKVPVKNVSSDRIDQRLRDLYAEIEAGRRRRPTRAGAVDFVRDAIPEARSEDIKRRFSATKPSWWKSGPSTNVDG